MSAISMPLKVLGQRDSDTLQINYYLLKINLLRGHGIQSYQSYPYPSRDCGARRESHSSDFLFLWLLQ